MIFALYYFFCVVLIFLGYKSLRGGVEYLKYFERELSKPESNFAPFVSIIVPCRGLDQNLYENLRALFLQEYPNYEVIFVVDSEAVEAVEVIKDVSHQNATYIQSKFLVAGKAIDSSQKVHNLREAVLAVSDKSEIFVFVDSDARPNKSWLKNLVAPLRDENVGCATGYRWFVSKRGGFSAQFRAVWNASIASALGANHKSNFCWGGSTAIRRATFEKLEIRKHWQGALSDDFAVTRRMKDANLPIYFVPQCLTATVENCTFKELIEFTTRQMKITRVYAPSLWKASFIGSFLFTAIFWTGVSLLFFLSDWHFWLTLAFIIVTFAFGAAKAWLRLNAVKLVLNDFETELKKQFVWQITLWTVSPALYFYNCFRALLSRKIIWRGIKYNLSSPDSTEILPGK
jgi:cellulose synthase/poly-beta-1,6-N-acetylglucosamine synthase-like glycosyltransferase